LQDQIGHHEFAESLKENVSLAPLTTLGIGGPARYFAECESSAALAAGVEWARARGLPLFVLGGGSNIVVADEGYAGLVLRVAIHGIETRREGHHIALTSGAGQEWDAIVAMSVAREWAGFECLSGIPGRVGATPIQNVGAYGQETSDTLTSLEALDLQTGELVELDASACEFGYRASRFKSRDHNRFIITRVTYRLTEHGQPAIRYGELQRYLSDHGATSPTLAEVRAAVITLRRRKAMVIDPSDADSRSVGSFFMNPTVTRAESERVAAIAHRFVHAGETMPAFAAPDDGVKLSAAWLIERAGIARGTIYGNVGTSSKHALAIINRGGGTAREVMELKRIIQKRVLEVFGVALAPEPVLVGFNEVEAQASEG
jgi:UDP-N-acetylmuramate dehydrogenase